MWASGQQAHPECLRSRCIEGRAFSSEVALAQPAHHLRHHLNRRLRVPFFHGPRPRHEADDELAVDFGLRQVDAAIVVDGLGFSPHLAFHKGLSSSFVAN